MIKPGQHVKVFFRNNIVEEGIVVSWSNKISVLKSLSSENKLIIQNTALDVQAVKVFIEKEEEKKVDQVYINEELKTTERDPKLRALKLAELRILRGREERERLRNAMRTFSIDNVSYDSRARYGLPSRLRQPPNFNTTKKDR